MPATKKAPRAPRIPAVVKPFLTTLRRVPDEIILDVMTREMDLQDGSSCLCAWFVKARLAEIANHGKTPDDVEVDEYNEIVPEDQQVGWREANRTARDSTGRVYSDDAAGHCAMQFGGTYHEWNDVYMGVTDERNPDVEFALVLRVDEAVNGR